MWNSPIKNHGFNDVPIKNHGITPMEVSNGMWNYGPNKMWNFWGGVY
jgi:hypothetical protein